MEIRFAETRDIPGMITLLLEVGEVHHRIRPDLFRAGAQKYEDGKVLGYCFCILQVRENDPVLLDDRTLYIDDLCVDEACRGKHVGQALYDHTVAYAREIGCRTVTLNVWCGNDSAMHFYEKQGLKPRNIHMETIL